MCPARFVVSFTCLLVVCIVHGDARLGGSRRSRPGPVQVLRAERRLGPFTVGADAFSVVLQLRRLEGAPGGFEETVESMSIVDGRGQAQLARRAGLFTGTSNGRA